ncbi:MAG: hypothetical protein K6F68_01015 [Clostridiales bacterium]|nr:hypothetical protein [Clostridiales bacterium]
MTSFFTWQGLVTYSDAVLATAVITQFLKDLKLKNRLPARLVSYLAALTVLTAATFVTSGFDYRKLILNVLNAVIVALAANGAFDAVNEAQLKKLR